MILRKPYALLIKNFKKIHLALSLLMMYIAYESNNILKFFIEYIDAGTFTRTSFSLPSTYINIYMFVVCILIAGIAFIIYILMRQKNKPKLLYLIIISFYLGLVIYFFQIYNTLDVLEISTINPRSLRIIRDIATVVLYVQYALTLLIVIRAVGFNIKKFNFGEDLAELEIDVTDNEEFELTVGIDPAKISRRLRRGRRELKYFIVENFFVLTLLSLIIVTSLAIGLFLNKEVYNKIYSQNQSFKAGYFVNFINNCYFTNLNQRGVDIGIPGKVFAILEVTFDNKFVYPQQLSLDDINLVSGKKIFSPIITRYQSFIDLGEGYTNQIIEPGKPKTFIFVFEVDDNIDFNDLIFRYRESIKFSATRLEAKYKKVKLAGISIDNIKRIGESKKGEDLIFKDSLLKNTKLNIKEMELNNVFMYDARSCFSSSCSISKALLTVQYTTVNKTLMRISYDYEKDKEAKLTNSSTLSTLFKSYGFLRYTKNNKVYNAELVDKTPSNYTGKDLFFQVTNAIETASKVEFVFRIRNKEYVYNLK